MCDCELFWMVAMVFGVLLFLMVIALSAVRVNRHHYYNVPLQTSRRAWSEEERAAYLSGDQ